MRLKKKTNITAIKKENNLRYASKEQKTRLATMFGELLATLEKPLDKRGYVY